MSSDPTKSDLTKSASTEWQPPPVLDGYILSERLGVGGMGVVYRATDPRLNRSVAIKMMLPSTRQDAECRGRFLREAHAQARLEHDHIVPVYAAGEDQGVPYLIMPVLKGEPLSARLSRNRLPFLEVLRIAHETCLGLSALHSAGLVHRDVKPSNIWIEESGRVRIMDFGLVRQCGAEPSSGPEETPVNVPLEAETRTGVLVGTPHYMSPEQADGVTVDARSDLFSFGCVLYEMLTGVRPFTGFTLQAMLNQVRTHTPDPVRRLNPQIPLGLDELVNDLLAKRPIDRPPSADVVAERLLDVRNSLARRRRRRWLLTAGGLVTAAVAGWFLRPRPVPPPPDDFEVWLARVRPLPHDEQMTAVFDELKRLNPDYDGRFKTNRWQTSGEWVTKISIQSDVLTNLRPLRGLTTLRQFEVYGDSTKSSGRLTSLEPLRNIPLTMLGVSGHPIRDLSVISDMPLLMLFASPVRVTDPTPIYSCRSLTLLHYSTRDGTGQLDADRLLELPLENVWFEPLQVRRFELLKKHPTIKLIRGKPPAEFWATWSKG